MANLDLLNKLLTVPDRVPEKHWDMGNWCGTNCCLMGHFCVFYPDVGARQVSRPSMHNRGYITVNGERAYISDLARMFGISGEEAAYLFAPSPLHWERHDVKARIAEVIARYAPSDPPAVQLRPDFSHRPYGQVADLPRPVREEVAF